ncbi:hypothetical protein C6341_g6346 [Phytophthora cactorum]|nr:hypothetical protein C6341_g6346 [Phytophthora cactorum]
MVVRKTQPGGIHQCVACARRRPSEPAAFQSLTFAAVQIYATNRKSAATATATNFQVKSRAAFFEQTPTTRADTEPPREGANRVTSVLRLQTLCPSTQCHDHQQRGALLP